MTMRRLLVLGLVLSGLSIIPWVRANSDSQQPCCEPILTADPDDCSSESHDEALQRYRGNQSRHWRNMLIGSR